MSHDRYQLVVNFYFLDHVAMELAYHRVIKNPVVVVDVVAVVFYNRIWYRFSLGEHLLFRFEIEIEIVLLYFDLGIYLRVYVLSRLGKIALEFLFVLKLFYSFFFIMKKIERGKTDRHTWQGFNFIYLIIYYYFVHTVKKIVC